MSTIEKYIFSHPKGSFERLNNSNYSSWKNNTGRLLQSIKAWDITSSTEQLPPFPAGSANSAVSIAARTQKFFAGTVGTKVTDKKSAWSSVMVIRPRPEAGKGKKLRE